MRRVNYVILMAVSTIATIAVARAAPAEERDTPAPNHLMIESAEHRGVWRGEHVEWHSSYEIMQPILSQGIWRLDFATPLPAEVSMTGPTCTEAEPVFDTEKRIEAVLVTIGPRTTCGLTLKTSVPLEAGADPPLAVDAPQRIQLVGRTVTPPADSPLELRLRSIRHRDLDREVEDMLEDRWGDPEAERPVILVPDQAFFDAGGLASHVQESAQSRDVDVTLLAGALIVLLALLGGILKMISRSAKAEEAEAFLESFEIREDI